ncbi:PQQ-binding-like beta-propeller repeat protein, partial [Streptomyces sp. NPDC000151]|uniref:outer membrane protein assembly factor BamB family protein n=1 Tax=Streptomyces sp. NPDC000151 TaxID=3154244 RepID=UPI00332CC3D0
FAAGGAVLLAGGGGALWWALRGQEADGGRQPWDAEPLSTYAPGAVPEPLWSRPGVAHAEAPAPLPVRGVVVIAAPSGVLRAYAVTDGKHRWTSPSAATAAGALKTPDGTVLTAAPDGTLLALGAADGKRLWSVRDADAERLLAADDAAVYVLTGSGRIRAIGLEEHTVSWTVPAPVAAAEAAVGAALAAERLVLHGTDGRVAALETGRGGTAWGPRKQGGKALTPAVADGMVYLGGSSLTALSLKDGARKWAQPVDGEDGCGAPVPSGGSLYVAQGGELSARRPKDGSVAWTLPMNLSEASVGPSLAIGHSVWLADGEEGENGVSTADTRSGALAWTYAPGTRGPWHLATADNRVFLLQAGTLTAMPVF